MKSGNIGPANHIKIDESMNDLPFKLLPPNQRDLERANQSDKLPAEPEEINIKDELQFYIYPFVKMEEKLLKVLCTSSCPNSVLKLNLTHSTTVYMYIYLMLKLS